MTAALPSLRRFALLNSDSDQPEVKEAVSLLISDLRTTISKSKKPGAARKSVAELLNFLHSMKTTVHPGRGALAQAISNDIIPLLYEEAAKPDTYKFLEAEEALCKHIGVIFKRKKIHQSI